MNDYFYPMLILITVMIGCILFMRIRYDRIISNLKVENRILKREVDGYEMLSDMQSDRLEKIAKYIGAEDYFDSIGPILEAIDRLKEADK